MIEPWIVIMVEVAGAVLACVVSHFRGLYKKRQQAEAIRRESVITAQEISKL